MALRLIRTRPAAKPLAVILPGMAIALGVLLRIGILAGIGVIAYLLLIVVTVLQRVSRNPNSGYGFHIQFRQGHRGDIDQALRSSRILSDQENGERREREEGRDTR